MAGLWRGEVAVAVAGRGMAGAVALSAGERETAGAAARRESRLARLTAVREAERRRAAAATAAYREGISASKRKVRRALEGHWESGRSQAVAALEAEEAAAGAARGEAQARALVAAAEYERRSSVRREAAAAHRQAERGRYAAASAAFAAERTSSALYARAKLSEQRRVNDDRERLRQRAETRERAAKANAAQPVSPDSVLAAPVSEEDDESVPYHMRGQYVIGTTTFKTRTPAPARVERAPEAERARALDARAEAQYETARAGAARKAAKIHARWAAFRAAERSTAAAVREHYASEALAIEAELEAAERARRAVRAASLRDAFGEPARFDGADAARIEKEQHERARAGKEDEDEEPVVEEPALGRRRRVPVIEGQTRGYDRIAPRASASATAPRHAATADMRSAMAARAERQARGGAPVADPLREPRTVRAMAPQTATAAQTPVARASRALVAALAQPDGTREQSRGDAGVGRAAADLLAGWGSRAGASPSASEIADAAAELSHAASAMAGGTSVSGVRFSPSAASEAGTALGTPSARVEVLTDRDLAALNARRAAQGRAPVDAASASVSLARGLLPVDDLVAVNVSRAARGEGALGRAGGELALAVAALAQALSPEDVRIVSAASKDGAAPLDATAAAAAIIAGDVPDTQIARLQAARAARPGASPLDVDALKRAAHQQAATTFAITPARAHAEAAAGVSVGAAPAALPKAASGVVSEGLTSLATAAGIDATSTAGPISSVGLAALNVHRSTQGRTLMDARAAAGALGRGSLSPGSVAALAQSAPPPGAAPAPAAVSAPVEAAAAASALSADDVAAINRARAEAAMPAVDAADAAAAVATGTLGAADAAAVQAARAARRAPPLAERPVAASARLDALDAAAVAAGNSATGANAKGAPVSAAQLAAAAALGRLGPTELMAINAARGARGAARVDASQIAAASRVALGSAAAGISAADVAAVNASREVRGVSLLRTSSELAALALVGELTDVDVASMRAARDALGKASSASSGAPLDALDPLVLAARGEAALAAVTCDDVGTTPATANTAGPNTAGGAATGEVGSPFSSDALAQSESARVLQRAYATAALSGALEEADLAAINALRIGQGLTTLALSDVAQALAAGELPKEEANALAARRVADGRATLDAAGIIAAAARQAAEAAAAQSDPAAADALALVASPAGGAGAGGVGAGLSADLQVDLATLDSMLGNLSEMCHNLNVRSNAAASTPLPGPATGATRGSVDDSNVSTSLADESLESLLQLASETLAPGGVQQETPGGRALRESAVQSLGGDDSLERALLELGAPTSGDESVDAILAYTPTVAGALVDASVGDSVGLSTLGADVSSSAGSELAALAALGAYSASDTDAYASFSTSGVLRSSIESGALRSAGVGSPSRVDQLLGGSGFHSSTEADTTEAETDREAVTTDFHTPSTLAPTESTAATAGGEALGAAEGALVEAMGVLADASGVLADASGALSDVDVDAGSAPPSPPLAAAANEDAGELAAPMRSESPPPPVRRRPGRRRKRALHAPRE